MDNRRRRDRGELYISDEAVFAEQARTRRAVQRFNAMDRSDFAALSRAAAELLGAAGEGLFINPPFYCDYGWRIEVGKNFYANYNLTILDVGPVRFGDNCFLGPNVAVYAAGHPIHPAARNTLYEYGAGVTVGNNVWIGGNTVICPGVTIGDNTVIGAGSVVTRDIPAWTLAAGNPCRPVRPITEADRETGFHGAPADAGALADMRRMWAEEADPEKYPVREEP